MLADLLAALDGGVEVVGCRRVSSGSMIAGIVWQCESTTSARSWSSRAQRFGNETNSGALSSFACKVGLAKRQMQVQQIRFSRDLRLEQGLNVGMTFRDLFGAALPIPNPN